MVIDLGSHCFDGLGGTGLLLPPHYYSHAGGAALQGVRLTQITTRALSPRAAHFPPLPTPAAIYPAYAQAPAAPRALLPDGSVFVQGLQPAVTIAFCAPDHSALRCVAARCALRAGRQRLPDQRA
jgi:hypothetical protein